MPRAANDHTTPFRRTTGKRRAGLPVDLRPLAVPETRTMELIGVDENGVMSLWDTGQVRPVAAFDTTGGGQWIKSGHYVIDWKGYAITVHCGNFTNGSVSVLFMCSGGHELSMSRAEVEAMLIGEVIPDPEQAGMLSQALDELLEAMKRRNQAAHRLRGRIGGEA